MSNFKAISYNSPVFSGIYAIALNPATADHRGYQNRMYFPDEPFLRRKKITAVTLYNSVDLSGVWMDGTPVTYPDSGGFYVTFCDQTRFEFLKDFPALDMSLYNQQMPIGREIDLLDSYVQYPTGFTATLIFLFFFEQPDQSYKPRTNTACDTIEFKLEPTPGTRTYLPNYQPLEDKRIRNIFINFFGELSATQTPNGYPILDPKDVYLTLIHRRQILFYRLPLLALKQYNEMFRYRMADIECTLSDSYVETAPGITIPSGSSVLLSFEYATK